MVELPVERLRRRVDPATLPFETTAEVAPLEGLGAYLVAVSRVAEATTARGIYP